MDNRKKNKSTSRRGLLLMTALTLSVFLGWHVVAEPDAQDGATAGESSPISERRTKVAAGANANARQLLERIAEGGATHSADDGIGRAKMTADHNAECS